LTKGYRNCNIKFIITETEIKRSNMKENLLKREIRLKGMSVKEFADKIGVSEGTLANWNQGHKAPQGRHIALMRKEGISEEALAHPHKMVEV
jgi:DNA-binding transcriptional regulator YiaG